MKIDQTTDSRSIHISANEKNKYRILTHMCGIQKNGTGEPICRAEIETQMQRMDVWTREGGMDWEIEIDTYTL